MAAPVTKIEGDFTFDKLVSAPGANTFKFTEGNYTKEECIAFYDKWAKAEYSYDANASATNKGAENVAVTVAEVLGDRKDARILDVAAGTGNVAVELKEKFGFTNMDALEPSHEMYEEAKKKNVYKEWYDYFLDGTPVDIPSDQYDLVVICGAFVNCHLPCKSIDEMIRVVKPGGYWVNIMRASYLETVDELKKLEPYMKELEEKGLWRQERRFLSPNYQFDQPGLIHVYRVL